MLLTPLPNHCRTGSLTTSEIFSKPNYKINKTTVTDLLCTGCLWCLLECFQTPPAVVCQASHISFLEHEIENVYRSHSSRCLGSGYKQIINDRWTSVHHYLFCILQFFLSSEESFKVCWRSVFRSIFLSLGSNKWAGKVYQHRVENSTVVPLLESLFLQQSVILFFCITVFKSTLYNAFLSFSRFS